MVALNTIHQTLTTRQLQEVQEVEVAGVVMEVIAPVDQVQVAKVIRVEITSLIAASVQVVVVHQRQV
jgi:hypothetical protein